MNPFKRMIAGLGAQTAPFGFTANDPNAAYRAGWGVIGDMGANMLANNQPGVDPFANLGASLQQAKADSTTRNKEQYTAQRLMEEAAAKRQEREQADAERQRKNDWLKSISDPQMRATLEANPGLIDNYVMATNPAFQQPQEPKLYPLNGKLVRADGVVVYDGGPNGEAPKLPPGYQWNADGTEAVPIKGTPQYDKAQIAKAAAENKDGNKQTVTDTIVTAADTARKLISGWSTGNVGRAASLNSESDAAEIYRQVEVLKSVASVENINAMRRESPTGAALGAASDKDLALLAAKAGALDPGAGKERFQKQLDDYELTLLRTVHGEKAGTEIFKNRKAGKSDLQTQDVQAASADPVQYQEGDQFADPADIPEGAIVVDDSGQPFQKINGELVEVQ